MPRAVPKTITVNDKMQRGYTYELNEPVGKNSIRVSRRSTRPRKC